MNNKLIKLYQANCGGNVGDTLTSHIIELIFGVKTQIVSQNTQGKLLGIGSIISSSARSNDTIWGAGLIKKEKYKLPKNCQVLALRGILSQNLLNIECEIFSDPAILLPLIYNPQIEKKYKIGIVEHYVDKGTYSKEGFRINVQQNWQSFIDEIKSCEFILSSSLHGLIIAEAYGIPCRHIILGSKIIGGEFKFKDYLSASNRQEFGHFDTIKKYQQNLINILQKYIKQI